MSTVGRNYGANQESRVQAERPSWRRGKCALKIDLLAVGTDTVQRK